MNTYLIKRAHAFMEKVNGEDNMTKKEKEIEKLDERNTLIHKNHKQGFYSNKYAAEKIEDLEDDVNKID